MLTDTENKWRTRLNFILLPEVNQTTDVTISGDFIELDMNIKLLNDVIDLLRNEKPLMVSANSDYGVFFLTTGKEKVGEEESRQFKRIGLAPYIPGS